MLRFKNIICAVITTSLLLISGVVFAATTVPFTVNMSEVVNVTGTPRIAVDVGGVTRYATYASGTGTSTLTFNYDMVAGDVDLDGVTLTSPIDLNGGTLKDLNGNDAALTFTLPNTSGVKVSYPSLSMDFTADSDGQYTLGGTPYTSLTSFLTATSGTFSRASVGTYFDSAGVLQTASSGTPRFDYDPVTHAAKGILIEESRTNIAPYSNFSSGWAGQAATPASLSAAPTSILGLVTKRITSGTAAYGGLMRAGFTGGTGTYTMSVFLRKVDWSYVGLRPGSSAISAGKIPFVNLDTLATSSNGVTGATITAENIGGGVVRAKVTWTGTVAGGCCFDVVMTTSAGAESGPGSVQNLDVAGAQLELGAFATSFIPTSGATVTRQADVLNIPTGSWYNSSAGSLYAESDTIPNNSALSGGITIAFFNNATASNTWGLRYDTGGTQMGGVFVTGGANQGTVYASPITSGINKNAHAMSGTTRSIVQNSGTVQAGTFSSAPTITRLSIGNDLSNSSLNGWIQKVKYYPLRASNTQLQLLTQ